MRRASIDHIFICTAPGAPAADRLREFGLVEGSPNQHPGQGTACRRFFFENAMLELIWLENAVEARSEQTRRTRLWERFSEANASPFGIVLRPTPGAPKQCPFPSWEYRPSLMPDLVLHIAAETTVQEPMWCYMAVDAALRRRQPLGHASGFRELTEICIAGPALDEDSLTVRMAQAGVIRMLAGPEHLLELQFDGGVQAKRMDFRPDLPLMLHW